MGNDSEENKGESGIHTVLRELLLLEEMRLRRTQVRESMRVRHRAPGASRPSSRRHSAHHGPCLTDLRACGRRDSRMHLLYHARSGRLSPEVCRVGVLSLCHWVARRKPGVLRDALMGRKWLRHHHRCAPRSPAAGLLGTGRQRVVVGADVRVEERARRGGRQQAAFSVVGAEAKTQ